MTRKYPEFMETRIIDTLSVVILIPVYRQPSADEAASLRQCVAVLSAYDVCLVCPEDLDTAVYDDIAGRRLATRRYCRRYFAGIEGYNTLLLSTWFYADFSQYEYMLIYQLDAWVFSDQLAEWCAKGYDYVGAPWFYRNKSHEQGERLWLVGNGGLSLRRVRRFVEVTAADDICYRLSHVLSAEFHRFSDRWKYLRHWRRMNGCTLAQLVVGYYKSWEDLIFCVALRGSNYELSVPPVEEAALFSIETSPDYVFSVVNRGRLPFGCHAWRKCQYEEFWKKYIPTHT